MRGSVWWTWKLAIALLWSVSCSSRTKETNPSVAAGGDGGSMSGAGATGGASSGGNGASSGGSSTAGIGSAGVAGQSGSPLSPEEVSDTLLGAFCDSLWVCPNIHYYPAFSSKTVAVTRTPEGCRQAYADYEWSGGPVPRTSSPADLFGDLHGLVDEGRVGIDAGALEACLSLIAACAYDLSDPYGPCRAIYTGTEGVDGQCHRSEECQRGLYCDSAMGTCPGTCRALAQAGNPCTYNIDCEQPEGTRARCTAGTCQVLLIAEPAAEGMPCADGPAEIVPCEPGLFCVSESGAESTCQPPLSLEQNCGGDASCDSVIFCNHAPCPQGSTCDTVCTALTVVETVGGGCANTVTEVCDWSKNLVCDRALETCQLVSDPVEGSPCDSDNPRGCNPGLYCELEICEPHLPAASDCSDAEACASWTCSSSKCASRFCGVY